VLAESFEGHRFNSPTPDHRTRKVEIYFSDRACRRDDMEMRDSDGRLVEGVYRIDAPAQCRALSRMKWRPQRRPEYRGDEFLYVADNNNNNVGARKLWQFRLKSDGSIDRRRRKAPLRLAGRTRPDRLQDGSTGRLYVAAGLNKANRPSRPR